MSITSRTREFMPAVVAIGVAAVSLAQSSPAPDEGGAAGATGKRRKSVVEAVGGFVVQPLAPDAHSIVVIDERAKKDGAPEKFTTRIISQMHLAARVGEASEGDIAITVVDEGKSAVFFEDASAVVVNGGDEGETEKRLMSALIRLIGIDGDKFGPHVMGTALARAKAMGIGQMRRTTYRSALNEGWAPPPTNDAQRAIWDKFHSATNIADKAGNEDVAPPTNAPIR